MKGMVHRGRERRQKGNRGSRLHARSIPPPHLIAGLGSVRMWSPERNHYVNTYEGSAHQGSGRRRNQMRFYNLNSLQLPLYFDTGGHCSWWAHSHWCYFHWILLLELTYVCLIFIDSQGWGHRLVAPWRLSRVEWKQSLQIGCWGLQ